jgi:NitT/TauT family transport system ATP-binding protein
MALIEFKDVTKAFTSRSGAPHLAVKDFELQIEQGEFLCLLGPSGCGKTTVLGMLAGFDRPSAGQISVAGRAVGGPSRERGVVFQGDDSLYPWLTAIENIEFGLRLQGLAKAERRRSALEYLALVGLRGQQEKFPTELSGGMKQRIQIARALATRPQILLMDEPFGALDAQTRGIMQRELRQIWKATGAAVLFITHDIDEAIALGTRVGIMTAGPGGRLKELIAIDLDERVRTDARYGRYYAAIHDIIRAEVDRAHGPDAEAGTAS